MSMGIHRNLLLSTGFAVSFAVKKVGEDALCKPVCKDRNC